MVNLYLPLRVPVVFLCLVMAGGCPSSYQSQQYGYVQREWSNNLRQLGIIPVFPPREDFFVGDIYAYGYDPSDVDIIRIFNTDWDDLTLPERQQRLSFGMSSRLARLPLTSAASQEYEGTPAAAQTSPDFNSILGNPALAAANDAVQKATEAIAAIKAEDAEAQKRLSDANRALIEATRQKEDADRAVSEAQAALTAAQNQAVETPELDQQLAAAKVEQRATQDEIVAARRALEDAGDDEAQKAAAQERLTRAERKQEDLATAITRLNEDIAAKKAAPKDLEAETETLQDAKTAQAEAEQKVTDATREQEDATAAATKSTADSATKLTEAEAKRTAAVTVRDAIASAGARMLYPQPQYEKTDVFTGAEIGAAGIYPRLNRFRLVAFPEFSTTSITQGDLSALVPINAMAVGLNISKSNVDKVVVKIPAAESYGVSFAEVFSKVVSTVQPCADGDTCAFTVSPALNALLPAAFLQAGRSMHVQVEPPGQEEDSLGGPPDDPPDALEDTPPKEPPKKDDRSASKDSQVDDSRIYIRVVSEVFYARAFDISIFASSSFSGLAEAGRIEEGRDAEEYETGVDPQGPIRSGVPQDAAMNEILSKLQDNLSRSQQIPGGSIQVVSYNAQSVGLRMVYDRPIAIGFRGVTLEYDARTDRVTGIVSAGPVSSLSR